MGVGGDLREDVGEADGAEHPEGGHDAEGEAEVADPVDHEGLDRRGRGGGLLVPEADQQIGGQAHAFPAEEQLHEVGGGDQRQHGEGEQRQIGEEPRPAVVLGHVAPAVEVHEGRDRGHHHQHHRRQGVDAESLSVLVTLTWFVGVAERFGQAQHRAGFHFGVVVQEEYPVPRRRRAIPDSWPSSGRNSWAGGSTVPAETCASNPAAAVARTVLHHDDLQSLAAFGFLQRSQALLQQRFPIVRNHYHRGPRRPLFTFLVLLGCQAISIPCYRDC